jgi:hypothetical protein
MELGNGPVRVGMLLQLKYVKSVNAPYDDGTGPINEFEEMSLYGNVIVIKILRSLRESFVTHNSFSFVICAMTVGTEPLIPKLLLIVLKN